MTYSNGTPVGVGDRVSTDGGEGHLGTVVAVIGEAYSQTHPESDWSYLARGILVATDWAGLIHYPVLDPEVVPLPDEREDEGAR